MAGRDAFVEDALQLLEPLGPVTVRSMFGGHGLYFDGSMFAMVAEGRLFLKTDDLTRAEFEAAGGEPFVYDPGRGRRPVAMSYWTPPAQADDDAWALLPWARRAVEAAARARAKKSTPPREKAAPRASARRPGKPR